MLQPQVCHSISKLVNWVGGLARREAPGHWRAVSRIEGEGRTAVVVPLVLYTACIRIQDLWSTSWLGPALLSLPSWWTRSGVEALGAAVLITLVVVPPVVVAWCIWISRPTGAIQVRQTVLELSSIFNSISKGVGATNRADSFSELGPEAINKTSTCNHAAV
jgi:hypothetical protein